MQLFDEADTLSALSSKLNKIRKCFGRYIDCDKIMRAKTDCTRWLCNYYNSVDECMGKACISCNTEQSNRSFCWWIGEYVNHAN